MPNPVGYSIYLSTFKKNKKQLLSLYQEGSAVFTSLHIQEEIDDTYVQGVKEMCKFLHDTGYKIIADVSRRTLDIFKVPNLKTLAEELRIDIIRVDYGFDEKEILKASMHYSICLNASTLTQEMASRLKMSGNDFYAMHNFYPRKETGLDVAQFHKRNQMLKELGFKIMAFIPGDGEKRGPLYEGLPTLEKHRYVAPYAAFVDMVQNYGVDQVFVGDFMMSERELRYIQELSTEGIFAFPVVLQEGMRELYNQIYTIRGDSPSSLMRFQESREYATPGVKIDPRNCIKRHRGTITMDNILYKRYSGEIQVTKIDYPADERVNVIGKIPEAYYLLLENIPNGGKIRLQDCRNEPIRD